MATTGKEKQYFPSVRPVRGKFILTRTIPPYYCFVFIVTVRTGIVPSSSRLCLAIETVAELERKGMFTFTPGVFFHQTVLKSRRSGSPTQSRLQTQSVLTGWFSCSTTVQYNTAQYCIIISWNVASFLFSLCKANNSVL